MRPNLENTYVILDNHSSHRSNLVKDYIRQNRINVWFLPTYSSDLNPCEWIWKLFKDKWYKEQYRRYLDPKMFRRVYSQDEVKNIAMRELDKLREGHENFSKGRVEAL